LINIGAISPGSNRRIDRSVALIDKINAFLIQPAQQRTSFNETVKAVTAIAASWDTLLTDTATTAKQKSPTKVGSPGQTK
jgi:hypothetical protein